MENEDQTPPENEVAPQTPEETAGETTPETKPEIDYEAKFKASQAEAIRLAKEVDALKSTPPQDKDLPQEKDKIFEALSEYEKQKTAETKANEAKENAEIDKLHVIHGDFDDKKLKAIVEKYGIYDNEGNKNWTKAHELYERFEGKVEYTPKKKSGARTQDTSVEVEKVDVRGKDFHTIIQESLKKLGAK